MLNKIKAMAVGILRWSEKYTKTDMVYLTKNAIWPVIGQLVASLTALVLAIGFSRLISKETYGTYKFITSLPSLIGFVLLPGIATALKRSIARGLDGDFMVAVKSKLRWASLYVLIGSGIALYYFIQGNSVLAVGSAIVFMLTGLIDVFGIYGAVLGGRALLKDGTMRYIIGQSCYFFAVLAVMYVTRSLLLIIIAAFLPWVIVNYYFFQETKNTAIHNQKTDPDMLTYGRHLSFIGVFSSFVANLDNLLVFHFLGAIDLAVYSYSQAVPDQLKGPLGSLDDLIFSRFAKQTSQSIRQNILRKCAIYLVVSLLFISAYWILAPLFYGVLFPRYLDAVFLSRIYSISLLSMVFSPVLTFMSAHGMVRQLYIINVATSIIQLFTMAVFMIHWGLMGLFISRIISRMFPGMIATYLYIRL